ncbi:unnamed protein product, partial [Rotaria magnacalcarata]
MSNTFELVENGIQGSIHSNEQDVSVVIGTDRFNTEINAMSQSLSSPYSFSFLNGCETTMDFDSIELSPSILSAVQDCEQIIQTYAEAYNLNIEQSNSDMLFHATCSASNTSDSNLINTVDNQYNKMPYPPKSLMGFVNEHDRPYAQYGHLSADQIEQQFNFDLEGVETDAKRRQNHVRFAVHRLNMMCKTEATKEFIMENIRLKFNDKIQYVCVGVDRESTDLKRQIYIQIIFNGKINEKKWFLDTVSSDPKFNYHVTKRCDPWNQYIKQKCDFIEYGLFKSLDSYKRLLWASSPFVRAQQSSVSSTDKENVPTENNVNTNNINDHEEQDYENIRSDSSSTINKRTSNNIIKKRTSNQQGTSNNINKKHKSNQQRTTTMDMNSESLEYMNEHSLQQYLLKRNIISEQALKLARTSISQAMDFVETNMPYEYMLNATKF